VPEVDCRLERYGRKAGGGEDVKRSGFADVDEDFVVVGRS